MSLSLEEFIEATNAWEKMDERLNKLIGFNPATSNHYGIIRLYNQRIDQKTSDEKIIEIRTKFLNWREQILSIFAENNFYPDTILFNKLFAVDGMYGTIHFLGVEVDIDSNVETYRRSIYNYLEMRKKSNETT